MTFQKLFSVLVVILSVQSGTCHDQKPGLPQGVDPTDVMYGVQTIKGKQKK